MALIITGGVSVNEASLSGHLLSLFQFPLGGDGGGGRTWEGGTLLFFSCFAVINYGTGEIQTLFVVRVDFHGSRRFAGCHNIPNGAPTRAFSRASLYMRARQTSPRRG